MSVAPASDVPALVRQVLGDALGYLYPAALRVAVRLGIADLLTDGPKTAQQLADESGAQAAHLNRVLRFLATRGVFHQDDTGAYHLTPAANLLRTDSPVPLGPVVNLFADDMYWQPAGRLEDTVRAGRTAFSDIFGEPFFDYEVGDEARRRVFDTGLADLSALEEGPIAASYGFPDTGTVVDVAGGRGGLLRAVLRANPGLRGVLFDREPVLAEHRLDDPEIAGRWETVAGDFVTAVPPGGDVYLLKRIVHDKSDDESTAVLRSCRKAMPEHARVLVIDAVLPDDGPPPPGMLLSDVLMMTVWDGRERDRAEFADLLAGADLALNRVIATPTGLSIVEAVPA